MTDHPESGYALADSLRERGDADGLVALLLSSDGYGRLGAAENLAEMKSPDALEPLLQCLRDADPILRMVILSCLGTLGDPRAADDVFRVAVSDPHVAARVAAADALYDLRDARTAAASRWLLRDYAHDQPRVARGDMMVGFAEGPDERAPGADAERAAPYMGLAVHFEGYGVSFVEWITQRLLALHAAEAIPELEATIKHARRMDRYRLRRTITKLRRFEGFASGRA
jgi:hypothetical protein